MKTVRIGCGAGYSGDRIDPAVEVAAKGALSYLVFECLAERTIALAQKTRLVDPTSGYDPLLEERMLAVLPICAEQKICVISNMGAANPIAAAARTREIAGQLGLHGLRIAAITGDDVLALVRNDSAALATNSHLTQSLPEKLISANAYLGMEPILEALAGEADVILTGRVADPSLFLAPLVHEFGWSTDDWATLGQGTVIGHLLECAGQVTGGYFADPGYKSVPNLAYLGFPIAEVSQDGSAVLTKVDNSGGLITEATCREQLLYEIQDPAAYFTPDVIADFSRVSIREIAADRVHISGGAGRERPETLKVSVGYHDGYLGEGQISYAGLGALSRARLAQDILAERLRSHELTEVRFDLIGLNSIHGDRLSNATLKPGQEPYEIRLRVAGKADSIKAAGMIPREVEALYTNGPASGGGVTGSTREVIAIFSTLLPRANAGHHIHYEVS